MSAAIAVFVRRFFQTRKPIEPGFVWSVAAVFMWLQFAPIGKMSDAYVATAGLILAASLIETSYVLAYHDELTGIRGRRAFNESLLSLDQQYAIAIVDIDHFKKFNDTYGHDIGDQVLCMVASRLSEVEGRWPGVPLRRRRVCHRLPQQSPPKKRSSIWTRCARPSRNPLFTFAAVKEEPQAVPESPIAESPPGKKPAEPPWPSRLQAYP